MVEAGGSSPRSRGTHWSPRRERGSRSAHPRVRGEHLPQTDWISCKFGSSPRSRGTPRCRRRRSLRARLIPAFAGNTPASSCSTSAGPAHPRVRGEHWRCTSRYSRPRGSSPRSRGTRGTRRSTGHRRRLIPAFAGNTHQSRRVSAAIPAHPRVRGEHHDAGGVDHCARGSSPRSRGTPQRRVAARPPGRLIPAFAGNTGDVLRDIADRAAHPRVRGEHAGPGAVPATGDGSSPRSRGTLINPAEFPRRFRLIPAFAGNTTATTTAASLRPAHPRVRGEHIDEGRAARGERGSSPRSRGTPDARYHRVPAGRLIPAFAGNTGCSSPGRCRVAAHPRVRGEHAADAEAAVLVYGSSPRSRGTLPTGNAVKSVQRLIPAFAGNTNRGRRRESPASAHPRVRGEHASFTHATNFSHGSSPRSRGTR